MGRDNQKRACFVLSSCVYLIYIRLPLVLSSSLISVPLGEEELGGASEREREGERRARVVVFSI